MEVGVQLEKSKSNDQTTPTQQKSEGKTQTPKTNTVNIIPEDLLKEIQSEDMDETQIF